MNSKKIHIATSLIPSHRTNIQIDAISSWQKLGMEISSLNCAVEIDLLKKEFPSISFIEQKNTGTKITGKPVIFISDIIKYLATKTDGPVGIINSDICLIQSDNTNLQILKHSKNAFFFGPRLDIKTSHDTTGTIDPWGFDYFFFDACFNSIWPQTDFCLGMPFWDHWFPLLPILHGKKAFRAIQPIGKHVEHPTSRDDSFFYFNDYFAANIIKLMTQAESNPFSDTHKLFGKNFNKVDYLPLRQKATIADMQNAPLEEKTLALEALARFFDELTKYVIHFLNNHSEAIKI